MISDRLRRRGSRGGSFGRGGRFVIWNSAVFVDDVLGNFPRLAFVVGPSVFAPGANDCITPKGREFVLLAGVVDCDANILVPSGGKPHRASVDIDCGEAGETISPADCARARSPSRSALAVDSCRCGTSWCGEPPPPQNSSCRSRQLFQSSSFVFAGSLNLPHSFLPISPSGFQLRILRNPTPPSAAPAFYPPPKPPRMPPARFFALTSLYPGVK
jgi:hypothetical protein